jgi:hypothetical protein
MIGCCSLKSDSGASPDRVGCGRAGWNIFIFGNGCAAQNVRQDAHLTRSASHLERRGTDR